MTTVKRPRYRRLQGYAGHRVLVKPGDTVKLDDPLITLESRQGDDGSAGAQPPARSSEILVKIGDKVSEGSADRRCSTVPATQPHQGAISRSDAKQQRSAGKPDAAAGQAPAASFRTAATSGADEAPACVAAALDSVRRRPCQPGRAPARSRTGHRPDQGQRHRRQRPHHEGRRQEALRQRHRRRTGSRRRRHSGNCRLRTSPSSVPIETKPLSRIKKLSGPHLHRNWVTIPHVTHFDDADITELEAFRKTLDDAQRKRASS